MGRYSFLIIVNLVAAGLVTATNAQSYNFVEIARGDGTGGTQFSQFQYGQSINDKGQAVFRATLDGGVGTGLFTGSGGNATTIVMDYDFGQAWISDPTIDYDGVVLFRAGPDSTRASIYGDDGGTQTTYAAYNQNGPHWYGQVVNLHGIGLLLGGFGGGSQLHTSDGISGPTLLYDAGDIDGTGAFFSNDYNENGVMASVVGPGVGLPWEILVGNGGSPLKIVSQGMGFGRLGNVSINNLNNVSFGANHGSFGPEQLYLWQAGTAVLIADLLGPYSQFDNFGMSLNDSDQVVFWAELDNGGEGIYLGDDPSTDALIEVGDPLLGSTVTRLHFERSCINNSGQILFRATLADGDYVMVRADPIGLTNPVTVDSLNVILGNHMGGQLSDLDDSDDSRIEYERGEAFSPTLPPLWLEFEGTLPTDSPNSLKVVLEAQVNSIGIEQKIEAYNFVTGQYELIDNRSASLNSDSTVDASLLGDISRFVESGTGRVKTRVTYKDDGTAFLYGWVAGIDQFNWGYN